jgi:hypothetical protein
MLQLIKKKKSVDLKNSAEALCYEADKELRLFKDTIPEELKAAMKEMLDTQPLTDKDNPLKWATNATKSSNLWR